MISADYEYILCDGDPDCEAKIKNHAWGKIKAEGWFFSKAKGEIPEKAYCPDHLPEWKKKLNAQLRRAK